MHDAVMSDKVACVEELILLGASLELRTPASFECLNFLRSWLTCFSLLPLLSSQSGVDGHGGRAALHLAVENDNAFLVSALLNAGADVLAVDEVGRGVRN